MSLYDDWKCSDPFEDDGAIQCVDCERPASESCHLCKAFLCRRCEDGKHVCEQQAETWRHIDPDGMQQWAWSSAGLCVFCGSNPSREDSDNGRCFCRRCDSCSSYWVAATTAGMDEGRPRQEDCPECVAADAAERGGARPSTD